MAEARISTREQKYITMKRGASLIKNLRARALIYPFPKLLRDIIQESIPMGLQEEYRLHGPSHIE